MPAQITAVADHTCEEQGSMHFLIRHQDLQALFTEVLECCLFLSTEFQELQMAACARHINSVT